MDETREREFAAALVRALYSIGLGEMEKAQAALLVRHYEMLIQWNRKLNLTRITEPGEAARLHYADSLFGGRFIPDGVSLVDIGSGAGFPAVPLAILKPSVRVTALESNQKKVVFLKEVKYELGLENLAIERARVEEYDLSGFDLLTSRALDRAEDVIPGVASRMGDGQRMILYCSRDLLDVVVKSNPGLVKSESHPIPGTEERMVALITRKKS